MTPENFAYWLQGYFEVLAAGNDPEAELTAEQVACIKDHLTLVLTKATPDRSSAIDPLAGLEHVCSPSTAAPMPITVIEQPKVGVEFWQGRPHIDPRVRTYCAWTGGDRLGKKVC